MFFPVANSVAHVYDPLCNQTYPSTAKVCPSNSLKCLCTWIDLSSGSRPEIPIAFLNGLTLSFRDYRKIKENQGWTSRWKRSREESKTVACVRGLSTNYRYTAGKNKRGVGVVRNDEQKDTEANRDVAETKARKGGQTRCKQTRRVTEPKPRWRIA